MAKGKENTPRIGIFGRCNAGKSTLMNFITGAPSSIVSPVGGTTTDPVSKRYEVMGLGPAVFIDTAGTDDVSVLGPQRTARTAHQAAQVDLAIVVFREWGPSERELLDTLRGLEVPYITLLNFGQGVAPHPADITIDLLNASQDEHDVLIGLIKSRLPAAARVSMFGGMLCPGDDILMVCPMDSEAPEGRMILPQVQALREILDAGAVAHVVQPAQIGRFLQSHLPLRMVVADSQVYKEVRAAIPGHIEVTTFSILLAAAKGDYQLYLEGLEAADKLREGDRILVSEFCSHQVSCEDIARAKIPLWLEAYAGCALHFEYLSPAEPLPGDVSGYALMVLCGGCMATRTQVQARIREARGAGLPVTNFGLLIRRIR